MMIKAIICDADDTLWSNEPLFRNAEQHCFEILKEYGTPEWLNAELYSCLLYTSDAADDGIPV